MNDLHIAEGLSLPADLITQSVAILARRGAGKTYLTMVMAEEMIKAGLPLVILDPLGACWGLRVSADGTGPGLPVTILGGDHGDIPLESTAGKVVADVIVAHPGAFILDLSGFESNAAQDRFVTDFAERIYRAKATHRDPLHLIIDEADSFAPQRPQPGQQRMLGAFEAIVRRGRIRGLGVTLVTQRPAVLNKNVLTQAECLITLQMTAPQDRAAIDEWVRGNGSKEERDELLGSLASLDRGDAWFWSPSWLRIFQRIHVRLRETWDSSKTPEPGDTPIEPIALVAVDLDTLRESMAATIEHAKESDPTELQKTIVELRRQLLQKTQQSSPEPERIEVPVLDDATLATLTESVDALRSTAMRIIDAADGIRSALVQARPVTSESVQKMHELQPAQKSKLTETRSAQASDSSLTRAERAILTVLAQYPRGRTKVQVAILSGYSIKSSSLANAIGALRSKGYAERGEPIRPTDAGLEALGRWEPLPTGEALIRHWQANLSKAESILFRIIVHAYPSDVGKQELSDLSGYSVTSSSFANALGKLRSLELIERGEIRASADLFEEVRS